MGSRSPVAIVRVKFNTVHLRMNSWYPLWEEDTRNGAQSCRSFHRHSDHGLHQPGCCDEVHSLEHGEVCSSVCPEVEPARAGLAGACGGVLRDRAGAVYASVLSGGAALSAGRNSVAGESE